MVENGARKLSLCFALTTLMSFLVYGLTAFPTITWWDAS